MTGRGDMKQDDPERGQAAQGVNERKPSFFHLTQYSG